MHTPYETPENTDSASSLCTCGVKSDTTSPPNKIVLEPPTSEIRKSQVSQTKNIAVKETAVEDLYETRSQFKQKSIFHHTKSIFHRYRPKRKTVQFLEVSRKKKVPKKAKKIVAESEERVNVENENSADESKEIKCLEDLVKVS